MFGSFGRRGESGQVSMWKKPGYFSLACMAGADMMTHFFLGACYLLNCCWVDCFPPSCRQGDIQGKARVGFMVDPREAFCVKMDQLDQEQSTADASADQKWIFFFFVPRCSDGV